MNIEEFVGFMLVAPVNGEKRGARSLYAGVERHPWEIFFEAFYANRFDFLTSSAFQRVLEDRDDCLPITCADVKVVEILSKWATSSNYCADLLVVDSRRLADRRGRRILDQPVQFLGFDVYDTYSFSLIRAGVHRHPELFGEWYTRLNHFGLLDDESVVAEYVRDYVKVSRNSKVVEDLPFGPSSVTAIAVGCKAHLGDRNLGLTR